MPRIIDGERNNMVANRFGITEKKKIQPETIIRKLKLWRSISAGDLALESKTGQDGHRH